MPQRYNKYYKRIYKHIWEVTDVIDAELVEDEPVELIESPPEEVQEQSEGENNEPESENADNS